MFEALALLTGIGAGLGNLVDWGWWLYVAGTESYIDGRGEGRGLVQGGPLG